jgi:hypothetical protein
MSNMTCSVCGASVNPGQRFCGECGSRVGSQQAASQRGDAADRNSVMHRPGGGAPDPFAVGAADDTYGDGDDDFFSQYRPKSAAGVEPSADAGELPTRRSRRRFNPNVFSTGPIEDVRPSETGQVSPLFANRVDESTATPAPAPKQAEPQQSAPPAAPFNEAGEPVEPRTRQMSLDEIQQAMSSGREAQQQESQAQQDEAQRQADAQAEEERARAAATWQIDPERRRVADEATFTQLIEGLPDDPADRPIESPRYVQEDARADEGAAQPRSEFAPPRDEQPEFAPLPEPEVDEAARAEQERANAFFAEQPQPQAEPERIEPVEAEEPTEVTEPDNTAMPALPPLAAQQAPEPSAPPQQPEPSQQAQPRQQAEDPADRELTFDNLMGEFDAPNQQARNEQESPASHRDWRASDRRAAERAATVGAGASVPPPPSSGQGGSGQTGSGQGGSGGDEPPRYSADEVQRRRKGVMTILLAAAAAVVLVLGALGINALFGGNDEAPVADGETQGQETTPAESTGAPSIGGDLGGGGTDETETAEPTVEAFDPVTFQSGSGNIRCQITTETGVACQLTATNFAAPAEMCQNGLYSGASVGVTPDGVTYPCLTGGFGGGQALEYDTPITAGPYTCSINYSTGVSCDNGDGDGFSLEYSAGINVTGDVADPAQPEVAPVG